MQSKNLNAKQQCFVNEYLIDLNGTQAAIRAGYSVKTANEIAAENLSKPSIKAAIGAALAERAAKSKRKALDVLADVQELAKTAKAKYMAAPENHNMLNGALKALELEGKHLGVAQTLEVNGGITSITRTIIDPKNDASTDD